MKVKCVLQLLMFTLGISGTSYAVAKIKVFACEPEWDALAREIGGHYIVSASATTAFQDPHYIEAKPSLIAKARVADLLFCTGGELEVGWLPLLIRQSGNKKIQNGKPGHLMASDWVEKIEVPKTVDRSMGDIHVAGNPHVHLDPYRILAIAEALAQKLIILDSANSEYYQQALAKFTLDWQKAISRWENLAEPLQGKRAVIHHRNFSYLFHWLGIEAVADLEPKPGLPPSSSHLASVLVTIQQSQPDFIILAAYQDHKGAHWLARRSNLPVVTLPYTIGGNPESKTLTTLFNSTIELLLHAGDDNG